MKKSHIAALVCFAAALLLYAFGSSQAGAGGLIFLGFVFELMAWKNVSDSIDKKK
jgi:Na+/phosphate symporter